MIKLGNIMNNNGGTLFYDESNSAKAMRNKKTSKESTRTNFLNLIFICIIGPIPPVLIIYYQEIIGNVFVVYFFSLPIIIAICFGIFINLRLIYLKTKYYTFNVKLFKDKIHLPSDRTKAIFSPEHIIIELKYIEKIFWNPIDNDEFIIVFKQNFPLKELAPLYVNKQIIHNKIRFQKALIKLKVKIDMETPIDFGYLYSKYKKEKKEKGIKWILEDNNPYINFCNLN
jgi:hypothetical protein